MQLDVYRQAGLAPGVPSRYGAGLAAGKIGVQGQQTWVILEDKENGEQR